MKLQCVICSFWLHFKIVQRNWKFGKLVHTSGWPRATNRARISLSINTDSLRVATWKLQSKTSANPSTACRTLQWRPRSDGALWPEPLGISCCTVEQSTFSKIMMQSGFTILKRYNGLGSDTLIDLLQFMKCPRSLLLYMSGVALEISTICYPRCTLSKGCES